MRATFTGFALSAQNTVARIPRARAVYATAWPKLPADAHTTSVSGPTPRMKKSAPRPLNERTGLKVSSLRMSSRPILPVIEASTTCGLFRNAGSTQRAASSMFSTRRALVIRRSALVIRSAPRIRQYLDVPVRSMHADPLPIPDQPGGMLHPHDGRQAVLPRDHRAVRHQAAHLRHQALDRDERRRPAGVRVRGDQDVARFELGLGHVQNDASPSLEGPGGNGQAGQRAGRDPGAQVRPLERLAIRREHPGRRERLIRPERILALADELVIHVVRAHNVVQLAEPEIEDVFALTKYVGLHEALGFTQQGLLVDEVAADHAA